MIITFSIYTIFIISTIIVFLFLKEVGLISLAYEIVYTNPNFDKIVSIIGDIFYAVGIGLVGAAGFYYYQAGIIVFKAVAYGIVLIISGASLKEYFKK